MSRSSAWSSSRWSRRSRCTRAGSSERADDDDDGSPIHGHTGLEIWWTAIPTALVVAMAVFSGILLARRGAAGQPTRGRGDRAAVRVVVPVPRPRPDSGDLVLEVERAGEDQPANDVIHSFWVPEFRMKQDAVPGIVTETAITPTKVGEYDVICTELCGLGHSVMRAKAIVLSTEDYPLGEGGRRPRARRRAREEAGGDGKAVFDAAGCPAATPSRPRARPRRWARSGYGPRRRGRGVRPGVDHRSERRDRRGVPAERDAGDYGAACPTPSSTRSSSSSSTRWG